MCALICDSARAFKNIRIVLVSPQIPENIGLCARVLKNTSFTTLSLVTPNLTEVSFNVAKRARDILNKAQIFTTLPQALGDSCFVFGTTRRKRKYKTIHSFYDILPFIFAQAVKGKVSILFGRENFGLSRTELDTCDSIFYIPAAGGFSSYNLAAACTIVCYKLFEFMQTVKDIDALSLARKKDIESLFSFAQRALKTLPLKGKIKKTAPDALRRLFMRTHLTKSEVQLLKSIILSLSKRG